MRLKDVTISANTGLDAIKRAPIVEYDTGLKCIRIQDISQGKDYESWGYTITTRNDYNKFRLKINDLLIARTGATVGVSYLVNHDYNAVFNNGSIRLRLNKSVNTRFVYYVFQTFSFKQYIDNVSCVATQPNLRVENLLRFTIPDFSLDKQNKIADLLKSFDDVIEVNNKRIKVLEQMAENLYKEWFVRFRFPGYESAEFENGIPKGWEYTRFAEVYNYDRGVSYTTEEIECVEGENLINLKNIQGFGGFRRDGTKLFSGQYKPEQVVKYKDLVMGVTDMTQDRRTVGAVALIPNIRGVISADLIKLSSKINNVFSYCMFRWGFYSKYVSQFGNGANVIHLKPSTIANKKFLIPTEKIITAFTKLVDPIVDHIESLYAENENLIKQRDLLLPRLMSGKLEV